MRSVEVVESQEIAIAMTASFPFAETRAGARGIRSRWRRFLDAMVEARRRKAEDEVARYLIAAQFFGVVFVAAMGG
jgi:hypothetical protein